MSYRAFNGNTIKSFITKFNVSKNMIFILIGIAMLACFAIKDLNVETSLVSHPDAQILFSTEDGILEQTWQPHIKKIAEVKLPYSAVNSFEAILEAKVVSDNYQTELAQNIEEVSFKEGESGELVFQFKPFSVEPGKRYRIQISIVENSDQGILIIPAAEDYAGCFIDGNEIGNAVALEVTFVKNSSIFWLMATFFPFLVFAMFFAIIWERKIDETLGFSFVVSTLGLFLFGIMEKLEMGIYAIYILSIICLILSMILYNRKEMNLSYFLTPGLVCYGGTVVFIIVQCRDLFMRDWDEYSHWGIAVKDMFYYNAFGKHLESSVLYPRYPVFSTLIEYFFTYTNGVFSEGILYVAYFALMFSLVLVVFKNHTWKNRTGILAAIVISGCMPLIFFGHIYRLTVDLLLAVIFAYILICYYSEDVSWFNFLRIGSALAALVLTKEMGLVLGGLAGLLILADTMYRQIRKTRKINLKKLCMPVGLIAIVGIAFITWQLYLSIPAKAVEENNTNVETVEESIKEQNLEPEKSPMDEKGSEELSAVASSGISIGGIIDIFMSKAPKWKYDVIETFVNTVWQGKTYPLGNWHLSYFQLALINLIAACILIENKYATENADRLLSFSLLTVFVMIGYAAFLLLTYLFSFSQREALIIASHERYLGSCICGICMAFWSILILEVSRSNENREKFAVWFAAIVCVLLFGTPVQTLLTENATSYMTEETIERFDEIEELSRTFSDRSESVYYVHNNSTGIPHVVFRNYICPLQSPGYNTYDIYASEEAHKKAKILDDKGNGILDGRIKTVEQWQEELMEYDYVFLHEVSAVFAEFYGVLFEDMKTIDYGTFYKVVRTDEGIVLRYIGKLQ